MTQDEALECARSHVLSQIQLVPCVNAPDTLYGFDPEKSYLFRLDWLGGSDHVGGSTYLAVSRQTGDVTMFGRHRE